VDYHLNWTNYTLDSTSNNSVTIPLYIHIVNDTIVEFDEIFHIQLKATQPRVNIVNSTKVTILNDDVLAVGFPSPMETVNESNVTYFLVLKCNTTASYNFTVNITIENISTNFADHNTTSIMERIPARMTMAHVKIPIDDELYENDETFQVVITSTSGSDGSVIIGIINSTRIIIVDNDEIDIYFQRSVYEFSEKIEKNEVPIHARLPMLGSQAEVVLKIQVTEENAINFVDYHLNWTNYTLDSTSNNSVTIPLYIHIVNDTIVEFDEIFHIQLKATQPRVNIVNSTKVTILNDDGTIGNVSLGKL
jgi:hypothetical protein